MGYIGVITHLLTIDPNLAVIHWDWDLGKEAERVDGEITSLFTPTWVDRGAMVDNEP